MKTRVVKERYATELLNLDMQARGKERRFSESEVHNKIDQVSTFHTWSSCILQLPAAGLERHISAGVFVGPTLPPLTCLSGNCMQLCGF